MIEYSNNADIAWAKSVFSFKTAIHNAAVQLVNSARPCNFIVNVHSEP